MGVNGVGGGAKKATASYPIGGLEFGVIQGLGVALEATTMVRASSTDHVQVGGHGAVRLGASSTSNTPPVRRWRLRLAHRVIRDGGFAEHGGHRFSRT